MFLVDSQRYSIKVYFGFTDSLCARLVILRNLLWLQYSYAHWLLSFYLGRVNHPAIFENFFSYLFARIFKGSRLGVFRVFICLVDLLCRRQGFELRRSDIIGWTALNWHPLFVSEDYWSFLVLWSLMARHEHRLCNTPKYIVILAVIKCRISNVWRGCRILQIGH